MNSKETNEKLAEEFAWEYAFQAHHNKIAMVERAIFYSSITCLIAVNPFNLSVSQLRCIGYLFFVYIAVLVIRRVALEIYGKGKYHQ